VFIFTGDSDPLYGPTMTEFSLNFPAERAHL